MNFRDTKQESQDENKEFGNSGRPTGACSLFLKPVKILLTKIEEIENLVNQWYPDDFLLRQQLFRLEVTETNSCSVSNFRLVMVYAY